MAQVIYSAHALRQLEQAIKFPREDSPASAAETLGAIRSALDHLSAHPLVGRRVEGELRELVISFGATGFIALYHFVVQKDEVRVLALRHQREVGYLP